MLYEVITKLQGTALVQGLVIRAGRQQLGMAGNRQDASLAHQGDAIHSYNFV